MVTHERAQTQHEWNAIASGYDEFVTPTHFWLGNEGLRRVGLRAGMRFLDVAAGSGALSIPAARLGARVYATDASPSMLERLRARAEREGLTDVETAVMDGQDLDLADGSFDVAGSQFGVMLFSAMPTGIREMARVVRSGGRVLVTAYGPPDRIEFLGFFLAAIRAVIPGFVGPPMDPPPLPFQLQDPERLRQVLAEAGLGDIRVDTITECLEFRSGHELWDWVTNSNPLAGMVLAGVSAEQREAAVHALDALVRERADENGVARLTNPINIGVGTR